jgi:hypothetical protein
MDGSKAVAATFVKGGAVSPVLAVVVTGPGRVTSSPSCSDPGNIAITVGMEQTQSTGKTTTTVTGFGSADPTWCGVDTPWSVIVTPAEGSKFVAGSAVATVHSPGATTVTQTVNLK